MTSQEPSSTMAARLLEAALPHVPFDGWSWAALEAAARELGVDPALARALFPRGGADLAGAHHRLKDEAMRAALSAPPMQEELAAMPVRARIAAAVRMRLELAGDKELVRRAAALFALPHHAGEGAKLIWGTSDAIWSALGDPSRDVNWYSKRATLSAVYSSCVLFWLGDDSPDHQASWAFLDRRIADVMQIEKLKARFREAPLGKALLAGPLRCLEGLRAP